MGGPYPIPPRPEQNKMWKKEEVDFFPASLIKLGHLILHSSALGLGFTSSAPLVCRPSHSSPDSITPMAFLGLQLADDRWWDFSASTVA